MSNCTGSKISIRTLTFMQCLKPSGLKRDAKEEYLSLHFLDKLWPIPAVLVSGKTPGSTRMTAMLIQRAEIRKVILQDTVPVFRESGPLLLTGHV